jgi:hypothetical protein
VKPLAPPLRGAGRGDQLGEPARRLPQANGGHLAQRMLVVGERAFLLANRIPD